MEEIIKKMLHFVGIIVLCSKHTYLYYILLHYFILDQTKLKKYIDKILYHGKNSFLHLLLHRSKKYNINDL